MIFPDKFTSFNDSILSKISHIYSLVIEDEELSLLEIYNEIEHNFTDLSEFLISIDILFMLEKINVDFEKGVISHVKNY